MKSVIELKEKIFISYRFTGENIDDLKIIMDSITQILKNKNFNTFCSLYKEKYLKKHYLLKTQRYNFYKQNIIKSDIVLFFIKSEDVSNGMKFELEQAIKFNKKIILAIQENLTFLEFRNHAHDIIEYKNLDQFYKILRDYNLK